MALKILNTTEWNDLLKRVLGLEKKIGPDLGPILSRIDTLEKRPQLNIDEINKRVSDVASRISAVVERVTKLENAGPAPNPNPTPTPTPTPTPLSIDWGNAPAAGTISGTVSFKATGEGLKNAELVPLGGYTPKYATGSVAADGKSATFRFDTTKMADGGFSLQLVGYDQAAGNTNAKEVRSAARSYTIKNTVTPPAPNPTPTPTPTPTPVPPAPNPADPKLNGNVVVAITANGQKVLFDESKGTKLPGTFDNGTYQQTTIMCRNPQLKNMIVFFDKDQYRKEVRVYRGGCWPDEKMADLSKSGGFKTEECVPLVYTAEITNDGAPVASFTINHRWASFFRYPYTPRPLVDTVANLKKQGLLPNLIQGRDGCYTYDSRPDPSATYKQPMDTARITEYMGMTGERNDIGPETEMAARYIVGGEQGWLDNLLAQAEGMGSIPIHAIDERKGLPISDIEFPTVNAFWRDPKTDGNGRTPWINFGNAETNVPVVRPDGSRNPISYEIAHHPNNWFVAYLLTKDPYYLRLGQSQCIANMLVDWWYYRLYPNVPWGEFGTPQTELRGSAGLGQLRAFAWVLRDQFYTAKMSTTDGGAGFHPKSFFQGYVDNSRKMLESLSMNSKDVVRQALHIGPQFDPGQKENRSDPNNIIQFSAGSIPTWQQDFFVYILGRGIELGFTEFKPVFGFLIQNQIARTTDDKGWPKKYPAHYYIPVRNLMTQEPIASYAEWWEQTDKQLNVRGTYGDVPPEMPITGGSFYYAYCRSALSIAVRIGFTEAKPGYDYINGIFEKYKVTCDAKYCDNAAKAA